MQKNPEPWSREQAFQVYNIDRWGGEYFSINQAGNISVRPKRAAGPELDLTEVVAEARERDLSLPLLIRFQDLLRNQVAALNESFRNAIREHHYQGQYRGVFPVKVNQLREVVEEILDAGAPYDVGLEVGSKPELFAALAIHQNPASLLICNGYKDAEFIRMALLGRKLNKQVVMVIEKLEELYRVLSVAEQMNVEPIIGIRVRLQAKGAGKWASSGGENAKFGLSTAELLAAVELLRQRGKEHIFQLVHFHVGSQIPDILTVKRAVREAARYYAKLTKMGFGVKYLDVGGGLGVDYNGSRTSSESSTNYTPDEYTRDIVYNIADICAEEQVPQPDIVSESGRAIVAHHSVLLVEVFGSIAKDKTSFPPPADADHKLVKDIAGVLKKLNKRNRRECLHHAKLIKEEAATRFEVGMLDLPSKARVETGFWKIVESIVQMYRNGFGGKMPDEVHEYQSLLAEQYLCNFSVFQSLIDHWAVGQLFPIAPIHRLNEAPTEEATLVDITCDSDGKIDTFINDDDVRHTLPLHNLNGQPYILGFFLMGAYQDVMGDLHNLFGPVTEAHVFLDEDEPSGFYIEEVIPGFSIGQVLDDVQYETNVLARQMKTQIDQAIKADVLKPSEGMRLLAEYEKGLTKPTYLSI
ncbi:MAG: biosynthetic arginine decarboxylase [Verrucomicrobiales bacterium]|jgi:arginine decarboxylase|nr:biosynthetic arginine decarboxylase [Verrucomicrobiales bacterium]